MPHEPPTVAQWLAAAAARLAKAGVPDARRDAAILIGHVLGRDRGWVLSHGDAPLTDPAAAERLLARREAREPVSRILGRREFWSLDFAIGPATLDPRPDSETLVGVALELLPSPAHGYRLLDLGTGTGCLLLALLHERRQAWGLGIDRDADAARIAADNARHLELADRAAFMVGDWAAALDGRFDLVIANPPYIAEAEIATLEPEVAHYEPRRALAGGADGLDAYRAILPQLPRLLRLGGHALFEFGVGQEAGLGLLAVAAKLQVVTVRPDLAGRPRCMVIRLT